MPVNAAQKFTTTIQQALARPAVHTVAYIIALLLACASLLKSTSWHLAVRYHSAYMLVLGLVVITLCSSAKHSSGGLTWGTSVVLVLTIVCMLNSARHARHRAHLSNPRPSATVSSHIPEDTLQMPRVESLEEGFAVASERVERRLNEQQQLTSNMNKSMEGAKINAHAISKAMTRFHDIHQQKFAFRERMQNVRKNIQLLKETYATNPESETQ